MNNTVSDINNLKTLHLLHKAMLLGPTIFAIIGFFLAYKGGFDPMLQVYDRALQLVAVVLSIVAFFIGTALFKKSLFKIRNMQADGKKKFALYRTACIIHWALIEGAAIFSIICLLLTANYVFIALSVTLLIFLAMLFPSKQKVMFQLQLSEQDIADL